MSTQDRRVPPIRYSRTHRRRKPALDVDLNAAPPVGNQDQEGTSTPAETHVEQPNSQGVSIPPTPIDLEAFDDEVIISSPRAFAEAKNNSRRNQGRTIVVDVDSEDPSSWVTPNRRTKRRRAGSNQTIINCDLYINLEGSSSSVKGNVPSTAPAPPPPPPPPPPVKEPTFSCPVCMGPLVEEMSTKCGHIFCKKCIKAAITAQNKCPTCRRRVTMKELIRVYLPATT